MSGPLFYRLVFEDFKLATRIAVVAASRSVNWIADYTRHHIQVDITNVAFIIDHADKRATAAINTH